MLGRLDYFWLGRANMALASLAMEDDLVTEEGAVVVASLCRVVSVSLDMLPSLLSTATTW